MSLQVNAILRRPAGAANYQLVMRWLGSDATQLPGASDVFGVKVQLSFNGDDLYLRADGTFDTSGAEHTLEVKPRSFAMIEPPRNDVPVEPEAVGRVERLMDGNKFLGSSGLSTQDRFYNSRKLRFTSGELTDEEQVIVEYEGGPRKLTFAGEWSAPPSLRDQFVILPPGYIAVGIRPEIPVDCSLRTDLPLPVGHGLGICHLLSTGARRIKNLAAERLMESALAAVEKTADLMSDLKSDQDAKAQSTMWLDAGLQQDTSAMANHIAQSLAAYLVEEQLRPARARSQIREIYANLVDATAGHADARTARLKIFEVIPEYRSRNDGRQSNDAASQLIEAWQFVSSMIEIFRDDTLIENLERLIYDAQQVRSFLSLRALQGGQLIDFWCSPDVMAPMCSDAQRGTQYPAPELVALGLTAGSFSTADVDRWLGDPFVQITVDVKNTVGSLGSGSVVLTRGMIEDARTAGTSAAVSPPSKDPPPRLNYDLLQSNVDDPERITGGATKDSTHVRHVTGDGLVQILMRGVEEAHPLRSGFNVYCMWEEESTEEYFDDPESNPETAAELKPWLVTRRYSVSRDLPALPAAAIADANDNPPDEPVFFRPSEIRDHGPRNNQHHVGFPLPANVQNPGSEVFSFDLRRGLHFTNGWDPRGAIGTTWRPELRRDGSRVVSRPQGYRFWITTIDFFGQESQPIAVRTDDPAAAGSAEYIYRPVYRTPLPAPTENGGADPAVLEYDADAIGYVAGSASTDQFLMAKAGLSELDDFYIGRSVEFRTGALRDQGARTVNDYIVGRDTCTLVFSTPWFAAPAEGDELVIRSPGVITIRWQTPFLSPAGRRDSDPRLRPPRADLKSNVALFRRPLQSDSSTGFATAIGRVPEVPQWRRVADELHGAGWQQFGDLIVVDGSGGSGDDWQAVVSGLQHADKGFEYVAAISMEVKPGPGVFWAPNVIAAGSDSTACREGTNRSGRCVQRIVSTPHSGVYRYSLAYDVITETPRHSAVAQTEPIAATNVEEPRGVEADSVSDRLQVALPILPTGGINRDTVLTRLLSNQFADNESVIDKEIYRDTGIELTIGQAAMLDAAIHRCGLSPDAETLDVVRTLLAGDLEHLTPPEEVDSGTRATVRLREEFAPKQTQNQVVGFRGLMQFTWRYIPLAVRTPNDDESEAVAIRIDQVRVPVHVDNPGNTANVTADAAFQSRTAREVTYLLTPQSGDADSIADLSSVVRGGRSALVRIEGDSESLFGVVVAAEADPGEIRSAILKIEFEGDGVPPATATAYVYFANELTQLEASRSSVYLPVGGGPAEIIAWWITTLSVTGQPSSFARRRHVLRRFGRTIQPDPPALASVLPPTDDFFHSLNRDDARHRPWLPSDLLDEINDLVSITPHLVASWYPNSDPTIGIAVHREDFLIDDAQTAVLACRSSVWRALQTIQTQPDGQPIQEAILRIVIAGGSSGQRWLVGEPVTAENQSASQQFLVGFQSPGAAGFLSARDGIKLVPTPGDEFVVVDTATRTTDTEFHADRTLLRDEIYDGFEVTFVSGPLKDASNRVTTYLAFEYGVPVRRFTFSTPWPEEPQPGNRFVIQHMAGFIDYFRFWDNDRLAMTVDYRHQYQLYQYLDVCAGLPSDVCDRLPPSSRYLRSEPTRLMAAVPKTAPIKIRPAPDQRITHDDQLLGPKVVLRIMVDDLSRLRALLDVHTWRYRVLARRKRFFSLASSPALPAEVGMEDIGQPASIVPGATSTEIYDTNLERPLIGEGFDVEYEIAISQFATFDGSQERIVRSPTISQRFSITIPPLDPSEDEVLVTKIVQVR